MSYTVNGLVKEGIPGETPVSTDGTIDLDASYPAGGYTAVKADFGYDNNVRNIVFGLAIDGSGNCLLLGFKGGKIRAFYPTGGTAASPSVPAQPVVAAPGNGTLAVTTTPDAGATTMTGSVAKPALAGVVSGALAAPATTPGAGKEVPTGANLAGFTATPFTAFGD